MTNISDRLLTSAEVEQLLGVSAGWCAKDRITNGRIPHVKIGSCCRYRLSDVQAYISASVRHSTSDVGAKAA